MPDDPRYPQSPQPLTARGLVSGYDPATLPSLPQRVLPRMNFAMVNGQMVPADDGPDTPDSPAAPDTPSPQPAPAAPLSTSRVDVDPVQLGSLVAHLAHGNMTRQPYTPPQQSRQPVLSPAAASLAVPPTPAVSHAQVPVAHLSAPVVGDRYVPPTFPQIMTSANPLGGVIENTGLVGPSRPRALQVADPYGADAWLKGVGPPPLMMGSIEPVAGGLGGAAESALDRGLYSRVDAGLARIPEQGAHPNRVLSLLQGGEGVSQEELAYRKVPEFLAAKGNQPVTRAELQAHLQANPAPMPTTTVLGGPNPARPTTLPEGYRIEHMGPSRFGGELYSLVGPDRSGRVMHADNAEDALGEALTMLHPNLMPTLPTKYRSYALPGGEAYREHLLQLPTPPDTALQALTDRRDAIRDAIAAIDVPIQEHTLPTDPAQAKQWFDEQVAHRRALMEEHSNLNDQIDAHQRQATPRMPYHEGHYGGDYPNVLSHVRTTERSLPATTVPTEAEFAALLERHGIDNAASVAHSEYGDPHSDLWTSYLRDYGPQGPRGRYLEEVQSDWHQQGKEQGYQQPRSPQDAARIAQLNDQMAQADARMTTLNRQLSEGHGAYLDQLNASTRANLPPEWQHLTSFSDATQRPTTYEARQAVEAWRTAREAAIGSEPHLDQLKRNEEQLERQLNLASQEYYHLRDQHEQLTRPKGVPDSPYKEAWPDLALKQQILDAARNPDTHWLGLSSAETQIKRWGSERLRWQRSPITGTFHVQWDPQVGGDALAHEGIADMGAEAEARGLTHHNSDQVSSEAELTELMGGDAAALQKAAKAWKRMQASPEGGEYLPRAEGFRQQYDQNLRNKFQKLVKPAGGRVEAGGVPGGTKLQPGMETRYRVVDPRGQWDLPSYHDFLTEEEARRAASFLEGQSEPFLRVEPHQVPASVEVPNTEPSWLMHFTPEIRRELLRRGFPIMALPLAVGAASLASRPGANVGQPPPVEPPLAVSHPQPQPQRRR